MNTPLLNQSPVGAFQSEIDRLRASRDYYRQRVQEQALEIESLKEEVALLQHAADRTGMGYDTVDGERDRQAVITTASQNTSTAMISTLVEESVAPKTPSGEDEPKRYASRLPYFYGEPEKWQLWRLQLETELKRVALSEAEKIRLISDHCKDIAFDLIAPMSHPYPYPEDDPYLASELIATLEHFYSPPDQMKASGIGSREQVDAQEWLSNQDFVFRMPFEDFDNLISTFTRRFRDSGLPEKAETGISPDKAPQTTPHCGA